MNNKENKGRTAPRFPTALSRTLSLPLIWFLFFFLFLLLGFFSTPSSPSSSSSSYTSAPSFYLFQILRSFPDTPARC